jgi:hypothetical protein
MQRPYNRRTENIEALMLGIKAFSLQTRGLNYFDD